jgi:two-component system response regulator AtoC
MGSNLQNVMTPPALAETGIGGDGFISGTSPATLMLESVVSEIASTNIPVLLVGESGTGKQMFANRIHYLSGRSKEPLRKISCASMTAETFAAEIGVGQASPREEVQAAGTVFLDEISELESMCQRTLLYALPDGDARPRRGLLTARLISTTSRNLDDEMRAGRFRRELYYRINGVCLRLPPLRERKEDIPLLAEFFLSKHAAQFGRVQASLSTRALDTFTEYSWPGNIRELENVVKKIVALNDEDLAVSELIGAPNGATSVATIIETPTRSLKVAARAASREAERELILKALARTRWNRKRAAQELQISYKSLLYKLKQIGLEDGESN